MSNKAFDDQLHSPYRTQTATGEFRRVTDDGAEAPEVMPPLTDGERNAMRAYLQRTEVRLSTLHRIAVAFINGAGLLVLFPIFFREVIATLVEVYLANFDNLFPLLGEVGGWAVTFILYAALSYPFLLSLFIPIYALYLLLKDIVHFYFTIYAPGFPEELHNPTFTTFGVLFSADESLNAKRQILLHQYRTDLINFTMPFSEGRRQIYFDDLIEQTGGAIVPETRGVDYLETIGVVGKESDRKNAERFSTALGLARSLDRTLVEEVAIQEASLVRQIMYLRRMVLRYMKTLMMFIWTTLVSFMMVPFLEDDRFPVWLVLSGGYLVWSVLAMKVMHLPIMWMFRHTKKIEDIDHVDSQLMILENSMKKYVRVAIVASAVAVMLALAVYL